MKFDGALSAELETLISIKKSASKGRCVFNGHIDAISHLIKARLSKKAQFEVLCEYDPSIQAKYRAYLYFVRRHFDENGNYTKGGLKHASSSATQNTLNNLSSEKKITTVAPVEKRPEKEKTIIDIKGKSARALLELTKKEQDEYLAELEKINQTQKEEE